MGVEIGRHRFSSGGFDALPLTGHPVSMHVGEPVDVAQRWDGRTDERGYAIAGGERRFERVEVSADGGLNWVEARLMEDEGRSVSWRFWEAGLELAPGLHQIVARATDSARGTQPEHVGDVWNFQGYANNAWHRLRVRMEG